MIAIHFSKAFAEATLDAIKTGKPIPLPPGGWTGNNMLTLAGVMHAGVFSQGPRAYQVAGLPASVLAKMHGERREAVEANFSQDIHDGIKFISQLASQVMDGEYDTNFQPEVKAVLQRKADGGKTFTPVQGFKQYKDMS